DRLNPQNASLWPTTITATYLDGRPKWNTGSAVIPKRYAYGIAPNGTTTLGDSSTVSGGAPFTQIFIGSSSTSTRLYTTNSSDWLGHTITKDYSNPSSVGDFQTTYQYNNQAQLVSAINGDLAPILNQYDAFGRLSASGMKLADTTSPS